MRFFAPLWARVQDRILRHPGRAELLLCPEFLGGAAAPPYQGREEFCPAPCGQSGVSAACFLTRQSIISGVLKRTEALEITWQNRGMGGNSNQRIELMAPLTLDRVLTEAEALPAEEQEILESLLRQRRIEAWRQETAAEARSSIRAFRSGKLKSQSAESLLASLRKSK